MAKHRRAGRNRKTGQRGAKGRLKAAPERGFANMNVVLAKRCANRGLDPKDDESLRKMRDAREGYVLGRLLNDGAISEGMHDAGLRFQVVYDRWAKAAGMPRITPPAGSYGLTIAGRDTSPDDTADDSQAAYFDAAEALAETGKLAEWETKRVCLEDAEPKNILALSMGLRGLRKHFC